ncbi:phosphatase PAP2 family protein [uncultured Thiothrix sp.]|uniref:phosphatase PAP2 family protein n=1 Tax=uncultured Thiothrix sp. TaxID=223185 RepID=UPI002624504F|nr:phosphatase PAP2 family protein [uncultured Thiothrix sp.]
MDNKKILWKLLLWVGLAMLTTLPFWIPQWRLDFYISNFFYHPSCSPQGWVLDCHGLYQALFYSSIPVISVLILLVGVVVIFWRPKTLAYKRMRLRMAYFVIVFMLGSGLVVNAIFKDHWGRPRPVQTQDFGGEATYVPPGQLVLNSEGRSFPSGHSSVGFAFLALWFIWRRERPDWAGWGLGFGLLFGYAIGLARMSAGAHYLSDVIWSGWMMALVAWAVYYPLMKMPRRERALEEVLKKPL